MNTILTDDDRQKVFESLPDALEGFMKKWGWLHFAKGIEAAVLDKLAQQEPVAWMREGWGPDCGPYVEFYRDDEMGDLRERKEFIALYTHPAPQQADRQRVPDGWKLVPMEPTIEMLEAMSVESLAFYVSEQTAAYRAMLAAAPEAPAQDEPMTEREVDEAATHAAANPAQADRQRVLEGWKLVPVEPTDEQLAILNPHLTHTRFSRYKALLAAAPEAPAQADRQRVPQCTQSELNGWFLSLPEGRQKVLVEDKWLLASAAFEAGKAAAPEAPAQAVVQVPQDFESVYSKALKESRPGTLKDIARLCYEAALAAAPEAPAQASAVDERAEFEHAMKAEPNGFGPDWFETDQHGSYTSEEMEFRWLGWQARAALAQKGGK